jgi:hypothetical protein
LGKTTGQTGRHIDTGGNPLKRVLVLAVLALGTVLAVPASAAGVCVHADVNVNGTQQTISQCVPPA